MTRIEHYRAGTLDEPFLPPIEEPRGLIFRLMYALMWRQFGKVFTPLKVHSARLPLAFLKFYGKISQLDKKLILAAETAMLRPLDDLGTHTWINWRNYLNKFAPQLFH